MDEGALEQRLSGPVALLRDGQALDLRLRKALALLALLALEGPRPREWLADLLWPRLDAAAARRNLRREVFRLRGLGVCFDDGDPHRLALAGLPVSAHGDATPLDGLDGCAGDGFDERLRERRAQRLAGRRRALLAQALQFELGGSADRALAIWSALLEGDPCDEEAQPLRMRSLARRHEPARALALYWHSVAALRGRLGAAPGAAVRALAESLLAPAPAALPLFAERVPFVPRAAVASSIVGAWQRRRPAWLGGTSGVGKTRLASECAASLGAWLHVACPPSDRAQPYATVVRLLRALSAAAPDVALPDWVRREVSQLLPEWGAPPRGGATAEARARPATSTSPVWQLVLRRVGDGVSVWQAVTLGPGGVRRFESITELSHWLVQFDPTAGPAPGIR
jgi:hypothetical protein